MKKLRELNVEDLTDILSRGAFEELISSVEHVQFECKSQLYDTKTAKSKIELAKDVSALANSGGGYLLIGPQTNKNPLHQGDEVVSVSEFASSIFQPDTYRKILSAFIYPPITDLEIQWHPGSADPTKGIASIYVPTKSVNEKPFIVAQSEIDSQIHGHMFGYFERVGDDALPTTVQIIRDTMKDGKRYGDLERRMENIEALVTKLAATRTANKNPLTHERLLQRAADARIAAHLLDAPSFFLLAAPTEPVRLNELFSSKSAEYQAMAKPPAYREHGFDLDPHKEVQLVRGELVRRVGWRKGLELWQDGTLIFVGRNDVDFLGWAVRPKEGEHNIYINNFVLTEVVSLFFALAIRIFGGLQNPPERIGVYFGLVRDQQDDDTTYELSSHAISQYGSYPGQKIQANNKTLWIHFELKDAIPEVETLKLIMEIYHWFGITDEEIPYVDSKSDPKRIDLARYIEI
jgi:hypothetical protein